MKYHDSGKRLSADERDNLEFVVDVENGSSSLDAGLGTIINKIMENASNMNSGDQLILYLSLALILGGTYSFKKFLDHRRKTRRIEIESSKITAESEARIRELENLEFMSKEDTERFKAMTDVLGSHPELGVIEDYAHDTNVEVLKRVSGADDAEIQGVMLTSGQVIELKRNARKKSELDTLVDVYRLIGINRGNPDLYKIKLEQRAGDYTITAELVNDFSAAAEIMKTALTEALMISPKPFLNMMLSVTRVGGNITKAELLKAESLNEDDLEHLE